MPSDPDAAPGTDQPCPHCGVDLEPPGRFCSSCGRAVGEEVGPTGSEDPAASEGPGETEGTGQTEHPGETEGPGALGRAAPGVGTTAPPPPASGRGASRRCSSCGAVNARARELCRACGLDLDPDDRTAVPPRAPLQVPRTPRRRRALRRWWVPVVAVLFAVPLVVGTVLLVAGLGPFAAPPDDPLDPVAFPAERYPVLGEVLALSDVATLTSAPPEGDRVFRAEGLVDGDPRTAWRSEVADLPAETAETIDLVLERPAWVTAIAISNGDHHDVEAYAEAGRIRTADLVFDGDVRVRARLQDVGRQRQLVNLDAPVLSTAVRVEIVEVVGGTAHPGAAVSSVEVRGHPATAQDAELAEERAARRPATGAVVIERPAELPTGLPWPRSPQGS